MSFFHAHSCNKSFSDYFEASSTNDYQFTEVFDDLEKFSEVRVTYNGVEDMIFGISNAPLREVFKEL